MKNEEMKDTVKREHEESLIGRCTFFSQSSILFHIARMIGEVAQCNVNVDSIRCHFLSYSAIFFIIAMLAT